MGKCWDLIRGLFCRGKFRGGKLRHLWKSQSSNCLTHGLTCKPVLRSESERVTNQIATESSSSSRHLKESAVPNTCPKTMDPQNVAHWHLHCPADTPRFPRGKMSLPSFKTKISHDTTHARTPPRLYCLPYRMGQTSGPNPVTLYNKMGRQGTGWGEGRAAYGNRAPSPPHPPRWCSALGRRSPCLKKKMGGGALGE